jgi:hypothetical protein
MAFCRGSDDTLIKSEMLFYQKKKKKKALSSKYDYVQ